MVIKNPGDDAPLLVIER